MICAAIFVACGSVYPVGLVMYEVLVSWEMDDNGEISKCSWLLSNDIVDGGGGAAAAAEVDPYGVSTVGMI